LAERIAPFLRFKGYYVRLGNIKRIPVAKETPLPVSEQKIIQTSILKTKIKENK